MTSNGIPEAVYLDAQAFENASLNFASKQFAALKKHLESGRLRLVITDITVSEVKSRIAKNVAQEVAAHEKFTRTARVLRSSETGRNVLSTLDRDAIVKELVDLVMHLLLAEGTRHHPHRSARVVPPRADDDLAHAAPPRLEERRLPAEEPVGG